MRRQGRDGQTEKFVKLKADPIAFADGIAVDAGGKVAPPTGQVELILKVCGMSRVGHFV